MKIYLAPMEGITGEVYRRAYHTFFEPMDKYFTPFLNPNPKGKFSRQEWNEILPSMMHSASGNFSWKIL